MPPPHHLSAIKRQMADQMLYGFGQRRIGSEGSKSVPRPLERHAVEEGERGHVDSVRRRGDLLLPQLIASIDGLFGEVG